jgi:large subunit ribosomal protein L22
MSDEKDEKLEPGSDPSPEPADEPTEAQGSDPKPKKKRRGSAETTTSAKSEAVAAPRDSEGRVAVRAQAKYVRCAPRKARLVVDHIRGKSVDDARAILGATPRVAARDVLKLLDSAVANAENNHELVADELKIAKVFVDEGPTLKRFQPRAQGRATRIRKRTSHMTILLTTKEDA